MKRAFDKILREVTRWALRKVTVEECLVRTVIAVYKGAQTSVRTAGDSFHVKLVRFPTRTNIESTVVYNWKLLPRSYKWDYHESYCKQCKCDLDGSQ